MGRGIPVVGDLIKAFDKPTSGRSGAARRRSQKIPDDRYATDF